ncbi:tripartite tricarboxylate transporter substrate binding protein [Roseomonas sp. HJA6]|uniref:Tripartite tricarboxylate transporter substrate binding protein n=1 Tax=Roseomonas alba TaxID=2846776 RepID=A0ABS7AG76_9PROT|nr:tripartite tricarboxylate transporter substrate binding protein [Neoroseomonas alba]
MERRSLLLAAPILTLSAGYACAQQTFPDRPLRLVIPFAAGGSNDVVGRLIAEGMGARLKQPVVVENRGGAGGILGNDIVAKSRPDGYTMLLAGSGSFVLSSLVQPRMPYNLTSDFTPIGFIGDAPNVIAVNPGVNARTMGELRDLARSANPPLSYGTAGVGTTGHAAGALLAQKLGVTLDHVPYRGTAPALTDVLAGRVNLITNAAAPLKPFLADGTLRGIALASPTRSEILPDLPTTAEQGFPEIIITTWYGLVGAGGTPGPIVATLHRALNETLNDPAVRQRMAEEGVELHPSDTPAAFGQFLAEDRQRWADVIRNAGLRID